MQYPTWFTSTLHGGVIPDTTHVHVCTSVRVDTAYIFTKIVLDNFQLPHKVQELRYVFQFSFIRPSVPPYLFPTVASEPVRSVPILQ